jgi:PIN domain nuclease of toxin-antitoxin system
MGQKMTVYVLDACAMVALINKEEGSEVVDSLFQQAVKGEIKLYISIINLLEVCYGFIGDIGVVKTQEIMTVIEETPLVVISTISQQTYHEAARIKGTYRKLSLADSVGIATAAEFDGIFVTSDHHELEAIASKEASLKFFWFR